MLSHIFPMILRLQVAAAIAVVSVPALGGQAWTCKKNELVRKIEIKADVYGKAPCSTVYLKPSEKKPDKEIARAKHDFPLCERKADDLALKLQNASWDCARKDS
jgi:hypothetical protein